ncbi:MAG: peptidylprolyl isomerase [Treponema sp.]|nr:peptidylprolyl isomerase [Treponema sp.]
MKKSFYTIGSLIILLISAIVFVLVPAMLGRANKNKLPAFGKYDGKEIRYEQGSDFADYVSRYADMLKNQGQEVNTQSYYYIFNYAFNATVQKMAFSSAVRKSGYVVPQSAINRAMLPYFSDSNGKYSPKLYKETPASSIESMQKDFRNTLTTSRYSDDCFGSQDTVGKEALYGLKSSSAETAFLQNVGKNKRAFNMVSFDMKDYPDSEKAAYGKANAQKFIKYNMSVITCEDKAKAESVSKRLANNEIKFADAVGEYSKKTYSNENGKLTDEYYYQLEKIIKNADDLKTVAALSKGTTSKPVETSEGFSIFYADNNAVQPDFSNDATIKDVYNYLNTYEAGHIEDYYTEIAKNFAAAASAKSFDDACRQFNLTKTELAAFPLNYGSVSLAGSVDTKNTALSGADTNENFLKTAFTLKQNEISVPVVNGKNILILQLTGESSEETPAEASTLKSETGNYDQSSASSALMKSPKLENNLMSVFFNNFMKNNNSNE